MEKDLTIVSSKTAKDLKDFGFDIICPNCYGVAVMHNGEYLGCDEEYELRAEGRGDEIEYVEYGMLYHMWFKNNEKEDYNVCAAPDIETVRKWFRDKYSIHITAMPYITVEGCFWLSEVYTYNDVMYLLFMDIIQNCPMGVELFVRVNTNYEQLAIIYNQRKFHKLKEDYDEFFKMIDTLPLKNLIKSVENIQK